MLLRVLLISLALLATIYFLKVCLQVRIIWTCGVYLIIISQAWIVLPALREDMNKHWWFGTRSLSCVAGWQTSYDMCETS